MRALCFVALCLVGCGPLKDPFVTLPAGTCATDDDCVVASCPNACNDGVPYCEYPLVRARADVLEACACFDRAAASECTAPTGDACGPQPGCAGPAMSPSSARAVSAGAAPHE